jgi:hypothetical protein
MEGAAMERILFGDNQFFGVNHMSEEKARSQAVRFSDLKAITNVLDAAYDNGIKVFMCTTQERVEEICNHVRSHPVRYKDFQFYPCMPYAHKYANAVTELGLMNAMRKFMPSGNIVGTLMKGGLSVARKDLKGMAELLIDGEMKMFHGLKTPVIFLQNVVTDLLLGLGIFDAFSIFAEHVKKKYNAEPGFITMNLPRLLDALESQGIDNPIVCASINKLGFRMCGGIKAYEHALEARRFRPVAMSVFGSGAIAPREALEYITRQRRIESIVFGASSTENVRKTKTMIDELDSAKRVGELVHLRAVVVS